MTALQEPFRYDYVGSFLRPEKVKKAKALYEDGKIEKEELEKIDEKMMTIDDFLDDFKINGLD